MLAMRKLVESICKSCEPYSQIFVKSLAGVSVNLTYTDIGFEFNIKIREDGAMIPDWRLDERTDLAIHAPFSVWNGILSGTLDYRRAYLEGMLRCQGSMATFLKGSAVMSTIIRVVRQRDLLACAEALAE